MPDPRRGSVTGTLTGRVVAVIVPAKDEAARIGATVRAALQIPDVAVVVVVDDGSTDRTAEVASGAGAEVTRHARNRGKGAAMQTGVAYVAHHLAADALLFVDADLQDSALATAALVTPVLQAAADMTIAVLPPQSIAGGGRGFVVRRILVRTGREDRQRKAQNDKFCHITWVHITSSRLY